MLGRKFPVLKLPVGVVVRMARPLPSLAQGVDDHSCHSLEPARLRRGGFQAISGSKIVISDVHRRRRDKTPYLVISNIVIRAHALYLHWTEHPANIVNDFNVRGSGLWVDHHEQRCT